MGCRNMPLNNFSHQLKFGVIGENRISRWLKNRGNTILPIYETEINTGKGPRLYTPEENLIAPDMLILSDDGILWIEAKHKTAFTWHRISKKFVTGIDLRHYEDYCKIAERYPYEVWLMFLHEGGTAKDSPSSPSGLFANSLEYLKENENHRHDNWGKSGMVYWSIDNLKKLAEITEI